MFVLKQENKILDFTKGGLLDFFVEISYQQKLVDISY